MAMNIREIAQLSGVSTTTVSYIINGKAKQHRISQRTIDNVIAIIQKHNYQPNSLATSLRAGRSYSIGLVIPDLQNTSYTCIASHLEHLTRNEGYQLLICCSEDKITNEIACINHLLKRNVDALIIATILPPQHTFYQNWAKSAPLIALDRPLGNHKFSGIIGADSSDAMMLTAKLMEYPINSILYLSALPELSISQMREHGFKHYFKHATHTPTIDYLYAEKYDRNSAARQLTQWLTINKIPSAIFTTSFSLFQGVIGTLLNKYQTLPKHILLATFGDHEFLDFLPCTIITASQQHESIAHHLFTLIQQKLDKHPSLKDTLISVPRQIQVRHPNM